ncbi:MAG TPA: 4Fe-4S binding protein [Chitinispirillaceae bacterium]|nr:4Fe-4S binding protein [Chitinispirillaceae bacterium]
MKNRILLFIALGSVMVLTAFAAKKTIIHKIDTSLCTQCGECIKSCPVQAIKVLKRDGKLIHEIDPSLCTQCGICIETCEYDAIKEVEAEATPKIKLSDKEKTDKK